MLDPTGEEEFELSELCQEMKHCKDVVKHVENKNIEASTILLRVAHGLQQRSMELGKIFRARSAASHGGLPWSQLVRNDPFSFLTCQLCTSGGMCMHVNWLISVCVQLNVIQELVPESEPNNISRYIMARHYTLATNQNRMEWMTLTDVKYLCRKIISLHGRNPVRLLARTLLLLMIVARCTGPRYDYIPHSL